VTVTTGADLRGYGRAAGAGRGSPDGGAGAGGDGGAGGDVPPPRRVLTWRPTRRLSTPPEAAVLVAAEEAVDFPLLAPRRLPWGYYLSGQVTVEHHAGCVRLHFRNRDGGQWWITQRLTVFSLDQEMAARGQPCTYVSRRGRRFAVTASARIGEPIEWHWTTTRQLISWEQDDRMCELESVRGYAPPLPQLLSVAARLQPAAPLIASLLCRKSAGPAARENGIRPLREEQG
jgi:hypothetical protein